MTEPNFRPIQPGDTLSTGDLRVRDEEEEN
jgi:hypothetical protein